MTLTAITTRFFGPGNIRGARIKATAGRGRTVVVSYDYALGASENHDAAALALCAKMGWSGDLVKGDTETGNVYVFASSDRVANPTAERTY